MKWRDSDSREELINAVAEYLQIVESGGDPTEFLGSLGMLAVEVRQIAGVETLLRVDLQVPAPSEIARGRSSLYQSITRYKRSPATAGPKLLGLFAAAGLGLVLGAGFASGAVPTDPLTTLTDSIPFFGGGSSSNGQDKQPAEEASPESNLITPQAPARIVESPILQAPTVVETQPPPSPVPAEVPQRSLPQAVPASSSIVTASEGRESIGTESGGSESGGNDDDDSDDDEGGSVPGGGVTPPAGGGDDDDDGGSGGAPGGGTPGGGSGGDDDDDEDGSTGGGTGDNDDDDDDGSTGGGTGGDDDDDDDDDD